MGESFGGISILDRVRAAPARTEAERTARELPDPATVHCWTKTCPLHGRPADEDLRPPRTGRSADAEQVMARVRAAVERRTEEESARVCRSMATDEATDMGRAVFLGTTNFRTGRTSLRPSVPDLEEAARDNPQPRGLLGSLLTRTFKM